MQKPETRALLGDAGTDVLIARQSSDLGKAVEALRWGADHLESSQAIVRAAVGVGLTVAGGGLALSLGRAVMAALMQDMVKTVDLLRSPETRALLGEEGVNALVQRQIADVGKVAAAIRTGWDNETRAKAMAPVLAQLAVDMSPLGTPESIAQLITGRESVSGEEASRLWAALGVIPLGGVIRRVGEPLTDVLSAAARKLPNALGEINLADDAFKTLKNVAPTPSGLINKTKLGEAAVIKTATIDQRLIISDVVANGDKLGVKTEALVNDVLKADPNFKILDAKYRGNNGLDHLVQYTDAQTGKTMTMVIDSKQLAKNGTTKLDPEAAGGVMQLSDSSLDAIVNALGGSPAAMALDAAMSSGTLVKAVAYVDKVTGELKIVRVDVPNPKR